MSAQETIYFKDLKPNRRSQEQFEEVLKQLQPHVITHTNISAQKDGFLVDYPHEKCANYIFITSTIDQLKALDLQAELATNTVTNRQIYLSNVPSDIYNKSIPELIDLLGQATGIRILKVNKFTSGRHFIVFIAESRVIRNEVFDKGTMVLAGHNIDPELPIIKIGPETQTIMATHLIIGQIIMFLDTSQPSHILPPGAIDVSNSKTTLIMNGHPCQMHIIDLQ